jgi:hypothetical protein
MARPATFAWLLPLVCCLFIAPASAQEPVTSPAATQPSTGRWVLRNQVRYLEARRDPLTGDHGFRELTFWNNLAYGVRRDLSLNLSVPIKRQRYVHGDHAGTHSHWAIDDLLLQAKWRIYQHDFGPIDTSRFSIIAALEIPTFMDTSTESVNPMIGGVYTHVQGRHGFNVSGQWKFNTGTGAPVNLGGGRGKHDALFYDASYLFRVVPEAYGPDTPGAWYAVLEMNGVYESNGDNELFVTPAVMYEARTWTIEAALRIPVWQDLDRRPKTRFVTYAGLRLLF